MRHVLQTSRSCGACRVHASPSFATIPRSTRKLRSCTAGLKKFLLDTNKKYDALYEATMTLLEKAYFVGG